LKYSVIGLVIEDFQNIKALELSFKEEGGIVKLFGSNEAGKSGIITSLIANLSPGSIERDMVQNGKDLAKIKTTLSNGYTIERIIKKDGPHVLKIKDSTGRKLAPSKGTATQFLKNIGNKLIDIEGFATISDEDRTSLLCEVAGIDKEELSKLQDKYQIAYDERTDLKREHVRCESAFQKMGTVAKVEEQTTYKELLNERDIYTASMTEITKQEEVLFDLQGSASKELFDPERMMGIPKTKAEIVSIETQIANLTRQLEVKQSALAIEETKRDVLLAEKLDERKATEQARLDKINTEIDSADEMKTKYQTYQDFLKAEKEVADAFKVWETKDTEVKNDKDSITELTSSKPMPMDGLTIVDGVVFYNDVPYRRLATSARLEIASILSMSAEPDLKVITIQDANRLGTKRLRNIAKVAKEKGFLVLIEIMSEIPSLEDGAVYLSDGEIMSEEWKREAVQKIIMNGSLDEEESKTEDAGESDER